MALKQASKVLQSDLKQIQMEDMIRENSLKDKIIRERSKTVYQQNNSLGSYPSVSIN